MSWNTVNDAVNDIAQALSASVPELEHVTDCDECNWWVEHGHDCDEWWEVNNGIHGATI